MNRGAVVIFLKSLFWKWVLPLIAGLVLASMVYFVRFHSDRVPGLALLPETQCGSIRAGMAMAELERVVARGVPPQFVEYDGPSNRIKISHSYGDTLWVCKIQLNDSSTSAVGSNFERHNAPISF